MSKIVSPVGNILLGHALGIIMAEVGYERLNFLAKITYGLDRSTLGEVVALPEFK